MFQFPRVLRARVVASHATSPEILSSAAEAWPFLSTDTYSKRAVRKTEQLRVTNVEVTCAE